MIRHKTIPPIYNRLVNKFSSKINSCFAKKRLKKLINADFTIISNNCWSGSVYRYFGLPYNTPTVGLYFFAEDYIKFLYKIKEYVNSEIKIINIEESRHKESLIRLHQEHVPIGKIDDVEIIFLHYKTPEEALEKWYRRVKRINWDNLYIKMAEMNECLEEHVYAFDKLPFKRKFIFTHKDYMIKSQIIMKDWKNSDQVYDDTTWFNKYINVINFLNGLPYKKRQ